jgi:hypothetical protein
MKITAYNPHVGSFLRALVLFIDNQCTRLGADLFMPSQRPRRKPQSTKAAKKAAKHAKQELPRLIFFAAFAAFFATFAVKSFSSALQRTDLG